MKISCNIWVLIIVGGCFLLGISKIQKIILRRGGFLNYWKLQINKANKLLESPFTLTKFKKKVFIKILARNILEMI